MTRTLLVMTLIAVASPTARADAKDEARASMERAMALHAEGRLAEALSELTVAFALDPDRDILYAIAQTHFQMGQCAQAVTFYERFLSMRPDAVPAAAAREAIETCQRRAEAPAPVVAPPPTAAPAMPAALPPPPPAPIERREDRAPRWYTDRLGLATVAGGVGLGVAGVFTYRAATGDLDRAETAPTYAGYLELVDGARRKRLYATVFAGAGVACLGVGVARLMIVRRSVRREVAIVPIAGGGLITWGGAF